MEPSLKEVWLRYRKGELTGKDNDRFFVVFILPLALGAIALSLFVSPEMSERSDHSLYRAGAIAFIPSFIICLHLASRTRSSWEGWGGRAFRVVVIVVSTIMLSFVFAQYESLVNVLSAEKESVWVHGPIIQKERYTGRWAGVRREVTIEFEGVEMSFYLNEHEYNQVEVGGSYGRQMKMGGLGYYYSYERYLWI